MEDLPRRTKRTLRLPFVEVQAEFSREAVVEEGDHPGDSGTTSMADWYAGLPVVGIVATTVAAFGGDWGWAVFGIAITIFGLWLTMRELRNRGLKRKAFWLTIDIAVVLAALGMAVAAHGAWWSWLAIVVAVFLAPYLATRMAPEERT